MTERSKNQWRIILVGWAVYALYMAVSAYIVSARLGEPITWWDALTGDLSYAAVWVVMTPLVLWLARLWRFEKGRVVRTAGLHLAASILLALVHKGIHGILFALYRSVVEGEAISWELQYRYLLAYFDYGVQVYWLILILTYAYDYYVRLREKEVRESQLETRLAQAQLHALQQQIHPHFLFNALNTIAGLVRAEEKQRAVEMIAGLSELLRASFDGGSRQEVTLGQELDIVRRYLEIEQLRFSDSLRVQINVPQETRMGLVPNLILQPLVENAVKHGVAVRPGGGTIEIVASKIGGSLRIDIIDDGPGINATEPAGRDGGVGLSNTRERLERMYGSHQTLELANLDGGGVRATIRVPWHTAEQSRSEESAG
jgi:sensor histidine kinase YesM